MRVRRTTLERYKSAHLAWRDAPVAGKVALIVPAAELESFVDNYAQSIARNAPLSILASKRGVDEYVKDSDKRDTKLCEKVVTDCFASQDYVEGRRAFMEKRKPRFIGK